MDTFGGKQEKLNLQIFTGSLVRRSLVRDKTCLLVVIYKNNINHEMYLMLNNNNVKVADY